ncbi:RNA-binding protein [Primorskyibacter sp. S187A]|uniref:RNA-binding protein n=1 Tax=Primorskyibacter sp. S187A TaxID=3415130 RepID=UPI003C7C0C99
MSRGGGKRHAETNGPERKCIATGEVRPVAELVRFVVSPDGQIVPDILGKLPGRGIWVQAYREAIDLAARKNLFSRAAKQPVQVPEGLAAEVEAQIARRVVDLISLARKSGRAVGGYEKVKSWLQLEEAEVLVQASDGSGRGKSKLSTPHYGSYIGWLTADELGMAFGRQSTIHGALASGGLTTRVVEEAQRLKMLRMEKTAARAAGKDKRAS